MHRGGKRAPPNHPLVRSLRCKPWVGDWQHSKGFHSSSIGYCKEVQQGFPLYIEIIETWVISIQWVQCRDVSHATDYRGLPPCLTLLLFLQTHNNQRNINLPVLQLCVCLYVLVGVVGHSGEYGNAAKSVGKMSKSVMQLVSIHFWNWFHFLTMKKAQSKLKILFWLFCSLDFWIDVSQDDNGILEVFGPENTMIQGFCLN